MYVDIGILFTLIFIYEACLVHVHLISEWRQRNRIFYRYLAISFKAAADSGPVAFTIAVKIPSSFASNVVGGPNSATLPLSITKTTS